MAILTLKLKENNKQNYTLINKKRLSILDYTK